MVVAESHFPRDGRHLEVVGRYNPLPHTRQEAQWNVKRIDLDVNRIKYWLSVGAQPSDTVSRLLGTAGIMPLYPRSADPEASKNSPIPVGDVTKEADEETADEEATS